jgi:(1->4)-alpha-D-glucan 1-alpha-D-glucosylmutase
MPPELRATYRVQLQAGFTLDDAAALADYLAALGVSHLYCSPYLQAAAGSTHGYDVVNHWRVNAELGGYEALERLHTALEQHGLGQVLDVVPNHMAIDAENPWWWDVLENGPSSRYATYFDVDWDPPEARHSNEVLLPVLGDHYGRVLEAGEIRLALEPRGFVVRYYDHVFPVDPRSLEGVLSTAAERAGSPQLAFIAGALGGLPAAPAADRPRAARRYRDQAVLLELVKRLREADARVDAALAATLDSLNADADALDELLERQNYRLAFWRLARGELGYRRFFDINSLIGLRMEDPNVFADTHALVLDWLRRGWLHGLRIDHPDGLRDPQAYFERLQSEQPGVWVVAEKILEPGECLPETWPVAGTTGYDFMRLLNGLLVDPRGEAPLTDFYCRFTGLDNDYAALVRERKRWAAHEVLGSDLNRLTFLLLALCERHRRYRDYTRNELRQALTEIAACLPVYRTYVYPPAPGANEAGQASTSDAAFVAAALAAAKASRPELDPALFDFLGELLLLRYPGELEAELAQRFQQFTGPVMAKGVEDTVFYVFNRLVSLNEVGGDPHQFGLSVAAFHEACAATQARWPQTLLSTSTHDTKRSGDVRARLHVLSEVPAEWSAAVERWAAHNARHRAGAAPSRNDEYLLYQTLVGAWPLTLERAQQYMQKAAREAKTHTSWRAPDAAYERALAEFVAAILGDEAFLAELEALVQRVLRPGRINALAQTLIKLTAPGVPDLYQGTELWDLSLVDPDNRRPVDFAARRALLAELDGAPPEALWSRAESGLPKLWVVCQALELRRRRPEAFGPQGGYAPAAASDEHAIAFSRGGVAVTVAPRFTARLEGTWGPTVVHLPAGAWRNVLTGQRLTGGQQPLAELLRRFPVALLERETAE